jgi:very-short-patch-repair endonuclease
MISKKVTDEVTGIVYDSKDEQTLHRWLLEAGYTPELQYKFIPGRRFRADFAFVDKKIAVEVMGLDFAGWAGHNNVITMGKDYVRDMIATAHGWRMIYWCKGVTKTDLLYYLDIIMKS